MREHISIRRAENGFIISHDRGSSNTLASGYPSETICEDTDAVLKALGELFDEMKTQPDLQSSGPSYRVYEGYEDPKGAAAAKMRIAADEVQTY